MVETIKNQQPIYCHWLHQDMDNKLGELMWEQIENSMAGYLREHLGHQLWSQPGQKLRDQFYEEEI